MVGEEHLLEGYKILNQGTDTLLTQDEADNVISKIESEEYINTVSQVITKLLGLERDLSAEEVFYITSRAEIIDAMNEQRDEVVNILGGQTEANIPVSIVMALTLNEILVNMVHSNDIKYVGVSSGKNSYETRMTLGGQRFGEKQNMKKLGIYGALRAALKYRKSLLIRRTTIDGISEKNQALETAKSKLIERGILVEKSQGSKKYKIYGLKVCKGLRKNSIKLMFSKTIGGQRHAIQRSISKHGYEEALRQVLEILQDVFTLTPNEIEVLRGPEYSRQELYS